MSQELPGEFVGWAPKGLAQVDGDLALLVGDALVGALLQQVLHNFDMASHRRPVQRCVVPLQFQQTDAFRRECSGYHRGKAETATAERGTKGELNRWISVVWRTGQTLCSPPYQ